jgi:ParB family chromosome partitioning protein
VRAENSEAAKVWPSIVEVRLAWITEQLLTRKTMPAGWEKVVAWVDTEQAGSGGSWDWGPKAAGFLGLKEKGYGASSVAKWLDANPTKGATVLLAVAIAKIELSVGVSKSWKGWRGRMVAEYTELLASWGYGVSEFEASLLDAARDKAEA